MAFFVASSKVGTRASGFSGATQDIWIYPAAIMGLFLLRGVFTFLNSYAMAYVGNRVLSELRVQMFQRLIALPAQFFDAHSSSSLVSRIVFEAQNTMQSTTSIITNVVRNSFSATAIIASLLWINWRLTLFAVVVHKSWRCPRYCRSRAGLAVSLAQCGLLKIVRLEVNPLSMSCGRKIIRPSGRA